MSIELNYKQIGEGQPLLILHGLFGSLDNWQTMSKKLAEHGFSVYTIDLRNHGKSPHTDEMNHEIMAQDIADFIEQQKLGEVNIMGHSMGGKTAMKLALTQPELISKLIVVDIAPKTYMAHHNIYFDVMMNMDTSTIDSRSEAQKILSEKIKNKAVLQFLLKNLDRKKDGTYDWKFNLSSLHRNYDQLIQRISSNNQFDKPTLFIAGQLSDYITTGDYAEIRELFPQAEFVTIKDAGHWVHAEKPKEFEAAVLNFLE